MSHQLLCVKVVLSNGLLSKKSEGRNVTWNARTTWKAHALSLPTIPSHFSAPRLECQTAWAAAQKNKRPKIKSTTIYTASLCWFSRQMKIYRRGCFYQ